MASLCASSMRNRPRKNPGLKFGSEDYMPVIFSRNVLTSLSCAFLVSRSMAAASSHSHRPIVTFPSQNRSAPRMCLRDLLVLCDLPYWHVRVRDDDVHLLHPGSATAHLVSQRLLIDQ